MRQIIYIALLLSSSTIGFSQRSLAVHHCESGEKLAEAKHFEKALSELNKCLVLDPSKKEIYLIRAEVYSNLGQSKNAITDYNIYIDLDPLNRNAYFNRAILNYQIKQYEQAEDDFIKFLNIENSETNNTLYYRINTESGGVDQMFTQHDAKEDPVLNYLGLIAYQLKKNISAIDYFNRAININNHEPEYYFNRGLVYEAMSLDSLALADYQMTNLLELGHSRARQQVAMLMVKTGDELSSQVLDAIIEENPNALSAYIERAFIHLQRKNYLAATKDYDMAIQLDSSNYELWLNRGIAKENLRDYAGAYLDYTQTLNLREDYAKGWLNRANILVKLNRNEDAITDYTIAINNNPSYSLAYYNRAIAFYNLNMMARSCSDFEKADELGFVVDPIKKASVCKSVR